MHGVRPRIQQIFALAARMKHSSANSFHRIGETGMHLTAGMAIISLCWFYTYTYESFFAGNIRSLARAKKKCIKVTAFDHTNDGKLIHCSGRIYLGKGGKPAVDPDINVSKFLDENRQTLPVLKLHRSVEMYQWRRVSFGEIILCSAVPREEQTLFYKMWCHSIIPSLQYGPSHKNPLAFPLQNFQSTATELRIGPFWLSSVAAESIPSKSSSPHFAATTNDGCARFFKFGASFLSVSTPESLVVSESLNRHEDTIGDLRITYGLVLQDEDEFSIICRQNCSGELDAYSFLDSENSVSTMYPRSILFIQKGKLDPEEMIDIQNYKDNIEMLKFRFLTLLSNYCGSWLLFRPLMTMIPSNEMSAILRKLGASISSIPAALVLTIAPIISKNVYDVVLYSFNL